MNTTTRMGIGAGLASILLVAGCSGSTSGSGATDSRGGSSAAAPAPTSSSASSSASSSSTSSDPAAVIKASLEAARNAKAFRIAGTGTNSGQQVALDIHYGSNGGAGSITMAGAKIQLRFIGSTVYFKAPDSFYRKQAGAQAGAVLRIVSGKWVKAPANSSTASGFGQLADRKALIDSFTSSFDQADATNLRKGGSATVDGVATTTYVDTRGKGSIDIASSGTPYPMKLVSKGSDSGTLTFTDWDDPYTASAPPASQTVTLPS